MFMFEGFRYNSVDEWEEGRNEYTLVTVPKIRDED